MTCVDTFFTFPSGVCCFVVIGYFSSCYSKINTFNLNISIGDLEDIAYCSFFIGCCKAAKNIFKTNARINSPDCRVYILGREYDADVR